MQVTFFGIAYLYEGNDEVDYLRRTLEETLKYTLDGCHKRYQRKWSEAKVFVVDFWALKSKI